MLEFMDSFMSAVTGSNSNNDNGPILYLEPNRTSAINDIRSVLIYILFVTLFIGFLAILPGIRQEKFTTSLCVTTSLFVGLIILVSMFGTTWHVGTAHIFAPYKSVSRDKIQGDLRVNIGLRSVNITLRALKLHTHSGSSKIKSSNVEGSKKGNTRIESDTTTQQQSKLKKQVNAFEDPGNSNTRISRPSSSSSSLSSQTSRTEALNSLPFSTENIDINYNERFYWIEPKQMSQEYNKALQRGLPYPILTVIDYLSQDEAGFSWARKYRQAGYYSYITLWLSFSIWLLMMILHCAAPLYGVYAMQLLGLNLLLTNIIYALLVPSGQQKLVIPYEGQSLNLTFGWSFWLVLIGGLVSVFVGTLIVIIDMLFPNYILTTILDANYDTHYNNQYKHKQELLNKTSSSNNNNTNNNNNNNKNTNKQEQQQQHGLSHHLFKIEKPLRPTNLAIEKVD